MGRAPGFSFHHNVLEPIPSLNVGKKNRTAVSIRGIVERPRFLFFR